MSREQGWHHLPLTSLTFEDKWQRRDRPYFLTAVLAVDGWMAVVSTNASGVVWAEPGMKHLSAAQRAAELEVNRIRREGVAGLQKSPLTRRR